MLAGQREKKEKRKSLLICLYHLRNSQEQAFQNPAGYTVKKNLDALQSFQHITSWWRDL